MTPDEKFFGTDGVRGPANIGNITPEVALRLGAATAAELIFKDRDAGAPRPRAVIGKDTRRSGDMLEAAIAAGLNAAGVDVELAGVVPTPAVAHLVAATSADLGIVISASHNQPADNGIKFFASDAYKLNDAQEAALEAVMISGAAVEPHTRATGANIGRITTLPDAAERYIEMCVATLSDSAGQSPLAGMKISLDTANGASSHTSRQILERLGADLTTHFDTPDGDNINSACGCTQPAVISAATLADGSAVGISHDGDADRILMCDENGEALGGDELMAVVGCHLLENGNLTTGTLVVTKMSNFGLDECIAARGGKVERTDIGDRHVISRMREIGANFGGEQSGHLIYRDQNTTGDGILAALATLRVMIETGKPLSELRKVLVNFPQVLLNIGVASKPDISTLAAAKLIEETETALGDTGRVLVRYSGTGPKMRILIEGKDEAYINARAEKIAASVSAEIGSE
jgi:phosphoglucosamine mutase